MNELSLVYRATVHSDPVMKAWLDYAAQNGSESLNEAFLSRTDGAGACTKCHAVSSTETDKNADKNKKGALKN